MILADDLGWNDVGYHGSNIQTPNIDRLAREGTQLGRFYVYPVCSPTRAGLMTARSRSRNPDSRWASMSPTAFARETSSSSSRKRSGIAPQATPGRALPVGAACLFFDVVFRVGVVFRDDRFE